MCSKETLDYSLTLCKCQIRHLTPAEQSLLYEALDNAISEVLNNYEIRDKEKSE